MTNKKAITFNAAGLSFATKTEYGGLRNIFNTYSDNITAYQMRSNPLTIFQDIFPSASALGKEVLVKPGTSGKGGHSIGSMIDALSNPKPYVPRQSPVGAIRSAMPVGW